MIHSFKIIRYFSRVPVSLLTRNVIGINFQMMNVADEMECKVYVRRCQTFRSLVRDEQNFKHDAIIYRKPVKI